MKDKILDYTNEFENIVGQMLESCSDKPVNAKYTATIICKNKQASVFNGCLMDINYELSGIDYVGLFLKNNQTNLSSWFSRDDWNFTRGLVSANVRMKQVQERIVQ